MTQRCAMCRKILKHNWNTFGSFLITFGILQIIPGSLGIPARRNRGIDMCEPIDIPMCKSMPYNMTRMPNHLHHSTIENARLAIEPYGELLQQNCSDDLLFFLCAMFAPICTPQFQKEAIPPCRSVCERSRQGCEPIMNKHQIAWPEELDCGRLPEYDKGVCVSPEAIVSSMPEEEEVAVETSTLPAVPQQRDCKCSKSKKPSKKLYKKGNFDYAIAGRVNQVKSVDFGHSLIQLTVTKVLKHGRVELTPARNYNLWTNSTCVCPKLSPNKEYLIIGYEDVAMNRLVYPNSSLAARWNAKWDKKFQSWNKRKDKKKGKKKKRRCKKTDGKTPDRKCKRRRKGRGKKAKNDNQLQRRRSGTSRSRSRGKKATIQNNAARTS